MSYHARPCLFCGQTTRTRLNICQDCGAGYDIPLRGGHWQLDPVRRVQVWVKEGSDVA